MGLSTCITQDSAPFPRPYHLLGAAGTAGHQAVLEIRSQLGVLTEVVT